MKHYNAESFEFKAEVVDETLKDHTKKQHKSTLKLPPIVSLKEFLEIDFPKSEPLLQPWLRKGDLSLVYSATGIGKTWFSLGVAWAVASGGGFLNWPMDQKSSSVEPRKVLVMDFEMSGEELQERLRLIKDASKLRGKLRGDEKAGDENLKLYSVASSLEEDDKPLDLSLKKDCAFLYQWSEGFDLVIIDNLTTAMNVEDENDAGSFGILQRVLIKMRQRGQAVILVHHANKSGGQRGSSAKEVMMNTVIKLEDISEKCFTNGMAWLLSFTKGRNLTGDERSGVEVVLSKTEEGGVEWEQQIDRYSRFYDLNIIKTAAYRTQAELGELMGVTQGTVSKRVTDLIAKGYLTDDEYEEFKAQAKARYAENSPNYSTDNTKEENNTLVNVDF